METFNYVDFETKCPACQQIAKDFQTKDGDGCMKTVSYLKVRTFYRICSKCGYFIEYTRKPAESIKDFILGVDSR